MTTTRAMKMDNRRNYSEGERERKTNKGKSKKKRMRMGTWNVRTMLIPGKMWEIAREMERYNIEVAALQEIRWQGSGEVSKPKFTLKYSGSEAQGQGGTAFIVRGRLKDKIVEFKPINERIAYIRFDTTPFKMSILNVYAPTENAPDEEKEKFYEDLEDEIEQIPKEDTILVVGDFNAQIGKEDFVQIVGGEHSIHQETNKNGQKLCNMAASTDLIISSTKFKHRKEHKVTWTAPNQLIQTQIDHVLVNRRRQSSVQDVRTYRGANADSDHFLVVAEIKQKLKKKILSKNKENKWDVQKLSEEQKRIQYEESLTGKLLTQKTEESIENKWSELKRCVREATQESIGIERNHELKEWFNETCKEMANRKINARLKWLKTNNIEDRLNYESIRKECKKMHRRTKRQWIDEQIREIETESQNVNTKQFYNKIKMQNRTYKGKVSGVKDSEGKIIEEEGQYKIIWEEHFRHLLNEQMQEEYIAEENEQEENELEMIPEPTRDEIREIILRSKNGKTPGKDGINMELFKYGGEELYESMYVLIQQIWKEEHMPHDWKGGEIVTIHKKGDQRVCENYRGITLLNTAYKILTTIIHEKLKHAIKNKIGQYQCGFTQGKSTVDAIHVVKQALERAQQHALSLELLFIDFKQAFDSVKRTGLNTALKELGVPSKIRRLCMMTLKETFANVRTQKGRTQDFEINKGVRQGDALSATLFNLTLQYVLRNIKQGTIRTKGSQIVAYADDVVIIAKNQKVMEELVREISVEGAKMGLKINEEKTKIMKGRKQNMQETERVRIDEYTFERVEKFKYLGVTLYWDGSKEMEVKERLITANKLFHSNKKLLNSKLIGIHSKMRIYRTIIRPKLMYATETISMTKKQEEDMRRVERKILRAILGPIRITEGVYRRRTNQEILEVLGEDIVKKIKQKRFSWLGHTWRAGPGTPLYEILQWEPGRRRRGRPRIGWLQQVKEDMEAAGITNWREKTSNRKLWKQLSREI